MKKQNLSIDVLRISLGIIFLWFGLLKFSSHSPALEIIKASFSFFGNGAGRYLLAGFETVIGAGLILNIFPRIICTLLVVHLVATFGVFILAPQMMFDPYFPFLTLEGEFVFKNLALVAGGLVALEHYSHHPNFQ